MRMKNIQRQIIASEQIIFYAFAWRLYAAFTSSWYVVGEQQPASWNMFPR